MVLQRWAETNRLYCTVIIEIVHTRHVLVRGGHELQDLNCGLVPSFLICHCLVNTSLFYIMVVLYRTRAMHTCTCAYYQ